MDGIARTPNDPPNPFGSTMNARARGEDYSTGCYRGIATAVAAHRFDPISTLHVDTCLRFPEVMRRTGRTALNPRAIDVDSALRGYTAEVSMVAGAPEIPAEATRGPAPFNAACPDAK